MIHMIRKAYLCGMLSERLRNRMSRELVTRFHFPPRLLGYRYLAQRDASEFDHELIDGPEINRFPLPLNVTSREELPRDDTHWPFSFWNVPERLVSETYFATIPNCRILIQHDEWSDPHYAIVTGDEAVRVRGTQFVPTLHAALMRDGGERLHMQRGTWILEQWDRNWAHWLQWHLAKIALLQKHGRAEHLILPEPHRLSSVVERSLDALGIDRARAHQLSSSILEVDELTVVGMDEYRPSLLDDLRNRMFMASPRRDRRLFISRAKSAWRRLRNEDDCWPIFAAHGYERVFMEDYSFDEQRALIGEAAVVAGVHGAGLTNVIFGAPGLHVIEIADAAFPNPQVYALASAMRHRYWLLIASPVGTFRPGYHDLVVDVDELRAVVERVEGSSA
jgi:capsular polysaccharide biosynthesis protein